MSKHQLLQVFTGTAIACAIAVPVHSQETGATGSAIQPALEQAIQLCLALPDGREDILSALTTSGWSERKEVATPYDPMAMDDPVVMMLASTFFARQHSTDDPKTFSYSAMNAWFMSVSILGNSALSQQPKPLFQFDDISLSVLALGLEPPAQPYCLFGGPVALKDALVGRFDFVPQRFDEARQPQFGQGQEFLSADVDSNSVYLFYFDQPKTLEDVRSLGPITSDVAPADFDYEGLIAQLFPATLVINSSPE